MKGYNIHGWPRQQIEDVLGANGKCVFVSYHSKDRVAAAAIADHVRESGLEVYFDQTDATLQAADAASDHRRIVECIEQGLGRATHLLSIISARSADSWWVPWEAGNARARHREARHLLLEEVNELPSFFQLDPPLLDQIDLNIWLNTIPRRGGIFETRKAMREASLDAYVARVRDTIRYR